MEQSSLGWWRRRRSCFSPPWSSASSTLLSALSIVSSTLSACLGLRKCLHIYCFLYEIQVKCCFRAIWIGMIAGITAYYAIGLKNVYDDMSDAPAAGLSLFMFMIVYLFEDMSFAEGLLFSLFSCLAVSCYLLNSCCYVFLIYFGYVYIYSSLFSAEPSTEAKPPVNPVWSHSHLLIFSLQAAKLMWNK